MSLEQFKQPETSEKKLKPEDIEGLRLRYEKEKDALRGDNKIYLNKTGKIKNEEMRKLALARLGLVSVRLAELDQEVMVGLN